MSWIDLTIFCIYLIAMLGVDVFFIRKNKTTDDYYVGGRKLNTVVNIIHLLLQNPFVC